MSLVSICSNCAIIYFTSNKLAGLFAWKLTKLEQLLCVVLIEHVIIGLKLLLSALISDVPAWVVKERHEEKKNYERMMDKVEKRELQFRNNGGVVIGDKIKELK